METRTQAVVRKGMKVYTSDGERIGKVREVHSARSLEDTVGGGPFRPMSNTEPVLGDVVDLDITGTLEPLGAGQPTQAELGVYASGRSSAEGPMAAVAGEDVGTDYKEQGETLDTRMPSELEDRRVADGYFKVLGGLDSADLYVPLSAVDHTTRDRVVLRPTYDELNSTGWGAKPAE